MKTEKEISKNTLFPTMVYGVSNVLAEDDRKKIIEDINQKPEKQKNLDFINEAIYQPLTQEIAGITKSWMEDHHWEYDRLLLTALWYNKLDPGEYHRPHSHGNNFISGVYYPEECDSDGIVFEDPRSQANVIIPYALSLNSLNSPSWSFPARENSLLMFPSWLKHHVPPAKKNRISISFNLMLAGMIGRESDLQFSEFS